MFSGIGGFELGISRVKPDWECVGYSEIDKYAIGIYNKHFDHKNYGNATKIDTRELPDFDCLVGGFPCQAFSIAGKRKGFAEARGTLFFEIARILRDKRPRYFVLENVKGLLSHDGGKTFQTILGILSDLGYNIEWQILNSKGFGVPQNRERIFFIGHLRGERRQEVFPLPPSSKPIESSTCLDSNYWKGADKHGQRTLIEITNNEANSKRVYNPEGISRTLQAEGGGLGAKTGLYALTEQRSEEAKRIRRENQKLGRDYHPRRAKVIVPRKDGNVGTITASQNLDNLLSDGLIVRRLTPIECERLQGFPDGYTGGVSDTQRYKCLGNAVTVNVISAIFSKFD